MKGYLLYLLCLTFAFQVDGQDHPPAGTELTDILARIQKHQPDQGVVTIRQDPRIANLLNLHVLQNARQPGMQGYRIRIYFDLGQKSRQQSEEVMKKFMEKTPGVAVYQSFQSPYWKVSVGDFRSRDSALKLYYRILKEYPKAFIVPEWINFPPLE